MTTLQHKFVDTIPEELEEGILYISIPYDTIIHSCCCGCGNEVVTPLSPSQWSFTYDGETISINPSIGNWSLNCQSHYYIKENRIIWSRYYSDHEIKHVRNVDISDNTKQFQKDVDTKRNSILFKITSIWKSIFPKRIKKR